MKDLLLLEKKPGETPLACINRFRANHPDYREMKMTYAGRLDPIASGLLIVLVGDRVHEKNNYLGLSKTYAATFLLGVATDTYDILGKHVTDELLVKKPGDVSDLEIITAIQSFEKTFDQAYPPYSSKTINGVQMHTLARANDLDGKTIPTQSVTVHRISDITITEIPIDHVIEEINHSIDQVTGDFRQESILDDWKTFQDNVIAQGSQPESVMKLVSCTLSVSGGTYIRSIAHALGQQLKTGACLLRLHRTEVGDFRLEDTQNALTK